MPSILLYLILTIVALYVLEMYFINARKGPTELKVVATLVAVICIIAVSVTEYVV